ncbi:MAG TPA: YCF48-related protein [Pyrinomonadaceae bacterium]|nr:YCF48-related protein [Pyrinomonadaceae bacterium]
MSQKIIFRTILALALFLTAFTFASAQWQKQTVETKAGLRGLSVVNQNVIWASGTGGTFLRTTDGGKTWKVGKVPDAEKLDFRDVEAFDANTAYLLSIGEGENSRIYKTTDGGETWRLQFKNTNPKAFFDAFAFWDANNGIAMSDPVDGKYLLISTNDGGNIWKPLPTDKMPPAREGEAAFAASGTCIITNGKSDVFLVTGGRAARVFRSNNRGLSWFVSETPIVSGGNGTGIFSIAMSDKTRGVIVGGNYEKPEDAARNLALTNDAGKTWVSAAGLNGYRSGVTFVDKRTVIAVGSSGSDVSRDGGKTWTNLDKENYNAVMTKGKNAVWAVGANGLVAKFSFK